MVEAQELSRQVVFQIPEDLPDGISGAGGGGKGGGGGRTPREDKNDLQARASARIIDLLGEGEIVGLKNGARSIFFDNTPLMNADGIPNFQGVLWAERHGTPDQTHVSGFEGTGQEKLVNAEITKDGLGPVVRQITSADIDAISIKIQVPMFAWMQDDGDIRRTSVDLVIEVQPNGGSYQKVRDVRIEGKTLSPYERAVRIELPAGGAPWNVRISRLTDDATKSSRGRHNQTFWASYTEIIDGKFTYPNSAYIGLMIDAEEFGSSIPARSYDVKGRVVQIPNNYDPETRTYSGIWNGGFTLAWTDNPAWVFYDLATHPRYGLGEYLSEEQVDKWALYQIAQYCDQLVPDGFGGEEPRFVFNGVINNQEEAFNCLQAIASAFRGMTYMATGSISVVADQPRDPIKLVAPADVINGEFTYSGTSLRARHTVAHVVWNDPEDNGQPAIEVVEASPDLIMRYGYREKRVIAYGCTSRGQAHRFGKWIIYSELNETETVTYLASWDHIDIVPGNIIKVFDPYYAGARFGGRLVSVAADRRSGVLDAPVELLAGQHYTISVTMPNGSLVDRRITNGPGTHTNITWSGALPTRPVAGAMFGITGTDIEPRQFRVMAIRESEGHLFEVTALLHHPLKFQHVEENIQLPPIPYQRPGNEIAPPGRIRVEESITRVNGLPQIRLNISWELANDPKVRLYEVMVLIPGGSWQHHHPTRTNSVEMFTEPGPHTIRVRSGDGGKLFSRWVEMPYTVTGGDQAPEKVTGLTATGGIREITLNWSPVQHKDVDYEIWAHTSSLAPPDSNVIQNAVKVGEVRATSFTHTGLPSITTRFYWVRAVSFGGVTGPLSDPAQATTDQLSHQDMVQWFIDRDLLIPDIMAPIDRIATLEEAISELELYSGLNRERVDDTFDRIDGDVARVAEVAHTALDENSASAHKISVVEAQLGSPADDPDGHTLWARVARADEAIIEEGEARGTAITAIQAAVGQNAADIIITQDAVANEAQARATQISQLQAEIDDNLAGIEETQDALADETQALVTAVSNLQAQIGSNVAAIHQTHEAINNEAGARATAISLLQAEVDGNQAAILQTQQAVASEEHARVIADTNLQAQVDANFGAIQQTQTALADETEARVSDVNTLWAEVDGNYAAIQQMQSAVANVDGLVRAQYTLQVTANGHIAGFGLLADGDSGSEIVMLANRFALIQPGQDGTMRVPFVVGTVNGQPRLSLAPTFIQDLSLPGIKLSNGTITANKMAANSITAQNGAIANLTVDTLKIANNSVTILNSSYSSGNTTPGTDWTTVATLTLTTQGGNLVVLIGALCRAAASNMAGVRSVAVRALRDGTEIYPATTIVRAQATQYTVRIPGGDGGSQETRVRSEDNSAPLAIILRQNLPAGTHTFTLQARRGYASGTQTVGRRSIVILERMK